MKKKAIILKFLFFVLVWSYSCIQKSFAQSKQIDSLKSLISHSVDDSLKVDNINQVSKLFFSIDPNISIQYATLAEKICLKINYNNGLALAYKNMGIAYYMQSKNFEAIKIWEKSLSIYSALGDKAGQANILSNLGATYYNEGDDDNAIRYYLDSRKFAEELNDSIRLATLYSNIASVYLNKKSTYKEALNYFLLSKPICEALKDQVTLGTLYGNLGEIYYKNEKLDSALFYLQKSLIINIGSENLPYSHIYLGKVYAKKGDYGNAIKNENIAFELAQKLNGKLDMTRSLLAIGEIYSQKEDFRNSIKYFQDGIQIALEIHAINELKDFYEGISNSYGKLKEFGLAYKYQTLLLGIKDKIYDIETNKRMASQMVNFEFVKRDGQIKLLTKDKEIQNQVIQRQKMIRNSFIIGFAIVIIFAGIFLKQRNKISKEKQRSEELLLNILPEETAEELKNTGTATAKSYDSVTVLFTDFKDFTKLSEVLTPKELVAEINECFSAFDAIMQQYGIEKIKTIGDAYMAAGGLPRANNTHPVDVVKAAIAIREFMAAHKIKKEAEGKLFFRIRVGVHTGPVVSGIVGTKKFAYDIWGDTVNTASRMESSGEPGKVNISDITYHLIKDKFNCVYRGKLAAKNKGEIDMYFVEDEIAS